jgi:hypothetical protein
VTTSSCVISRSTSSVSATVLWAFNITSF